ncbi:hypothetical protein FBY33_2111 [Arthrobacter sp. SLBN-112]|uniref:hypothetical protein n=1 Tax=Arthrobacter sp. SLBN-112 TaxID=2768452 RepID=UPI00114F0E4E|nr:hypothetical protein [Arthrobacter sp. SLBN-112]TQJ40061.1 hypothetical protein FBY33_2111 [Arthrobacter sp. SLBN-112]
MDYDRWQAKLSEEFFPMDQPDEPVIMFLDDDEMARICPDLPDPVASLRSAVLAELRQTDTSAIFEPLDRRMAAWRKGPQDQPPPCLPLLAVTVIAGSRMRNDGAFSSAAYYPRLVSLMTSGTNRLTATGIQKHFDLVADMWQTLDDWIERNDHLLGPSTIRTHQTFNRIGYPLSQTVLKASDRERLSGFFDRLRVDRSSRSSPNQLLDLLRLWMDKPRGFSTAFVDLVQKGQGNPLLLAVISKLAVEQSSGPPVVKGRVRLDLRMCIDPEDWSMSWTIPVDPRLEMDELRQDNGSLFSIQKPDYGSVYDVVRGSLPQGAPLINHRFRAVGTRAFLTKNVREMWILRIDPSSGQWQSVPEATPDETHLFVVRDTDVAEMEELLTRSAAPGYWKLRGKLFPGWTVYVDVSLVEPIDLSAAGAFNSLGQLLKAPPNSRPKLVNGLELRTDVGGRHYLQGGEPDVQLPEESSNESVHVVLDNRLPGTRLKANGSLFPLRVAGPFTEGKHTVSVAGVALDFFVHTTGSAAQWEAAHTKGQDDVVPPGPALEAGAPEYVLCRRGRNAAVWFVSPSGLVRRRGEPRIPLFITRFGFPQSYQWKVSVPGGTTWVLTERAGKLSRPQRISSDPPNFGSLERHSQEFWRRAARETINNEDRLWRSYLSQSMEDSIYGR